MHESRVAAGDRLKSANSFEFSLVRFRRFERVAPNDFDRSVCPGQMIARQPNFAITSGGYGPDELMVGNLPGQLRAELLALPERVFERRLGPGGHFRALFLKPRIYQASGYACQAAS
jgi:hypothetical protein